jgi:acid stress chaperone HdeB
MAVDASARGADPETIDAIVALLCCVGGAVWLSAPCAAKLAIGSPTMSTFSRALAMPAPAQVTVDVARITCEEYVLFTVADPHDIAMWLSGYFNGMQDNTVLDTQQFREHAKQVLEYCELNLKVPVMEAAEKVLGIRK